MDDRAQFTYAIMIFEFIFGYDWAAAALTWQWFLWIVLTLLQMIAERIQF